MKICNCDDDPKFCARILVLFFCLLLALVLSISQWNDEIAIRELELTRSPNDSAPQAYLNSEEGPHRTSIKERLH